MKRNQFSTVIFLLTAVSNCYGEIDYCEFKKEYFLSGYITANEEGPLDDLSNIKTFTTKINAE